MTASKTNINTLKPGKLLELANFLTQFQNHYSTPDDNFGDGDEGDSDQKASRNILITLTDLEAVTEYRRNIFKRETLKDRYYVAQESSKTKSTANVICSLQITRLEQEIERVNSKISDVSQRVKRIHRLLQRFEVWTSKLLAQKDFVAPCDALLKENKTTKYTYFSAHLNIPCSDHFCKILPGVSHNDWSIPRLPSAMHHMPEAKCTLALTPNKHTWQEFAKISRMLSLLDETPRKEIYGRSSCIFDIKNKNSCKESYNQQFEFEPLDLMALWVRAQRNSQAMRHLYLLFEHGCHEDDTIVGVGAEDGEQNKAERSKLERSAIYKGNPTNARQRICEMSPWVDRLVEWAVLNQTLFSHHNVRSHIQLAFLKRRRKRQDKEELQSKRQRKRMRREGGSDEKELEELRQACLVFILRWFGRRHRKLTSVLFSKKQNILHLDIGCRQGDRNSANLLHKLVDADIHKHLLKPEIDGVAAFAKDRTLARIDRRIRNYRNQISLTSQVQTLLDALCSAGKSHGVSSELIETAKSDLHLLHSHYFHDGERILDTAAMLLDMGNESITSISNLLNGVPSPWKQHCALCSFPGKDGSPLRTCACCETPFHEGCSKWRKESISKIISSYKPLRKLCALQLPPMQSLPDFRDDSRVTWTEMEILVERRPHDLGGLEMALGLSFTRTQACHNSFCILTKNGTVIDLAKMIAADKTNKKPSLPVALQVHGSLIHDVANSGAGKRAGLQKGDVIQHLQIVELFNGANISSNASERSFDFRNLSPYECRKVFEIPATRLKLRILRPSIDVVQSSRNWYEQIKILNKAGTAALNEINTGDKFGTLWFCENCTEDQPPTHSLKEEAEFCRAVVRRIGMESYAGPFENECSEGKGIYPAASLRRLDAMMTHIINQQHTDSKLGESSIRAFSNPSCGVDGGTHLAWAAGLEEKPMELMCSGFSTLFKSDLNGERRNVSDVTAMFRHFLVAFISWCYLPCEGNGRTKGPPPLFRKMHSPNILPSCSMCTGRPVTAESSKVCNHPTCSILARINNFQMEDFPNEEVEALADALQEYEARSSLVGTTFLVPHDDDLVKAVSKVVHIEHNQRPVEFMVASYLPGEFRDMVFSGNATWEGDRCSDDGGIFHLLPVVTTLQMHYLSDRLKPRKKPTEPSTDDVSWASLDALNLAGVARYTFAALEQKLIESAKMHDAIEVAIVRKCMKPYGGRSSNCKEIARGLELFDLEAFGNCLSSAASHLLLQDNFQAGSTATEEQNGSATHRSDWPIVPRKENEREQELFGQTLPLPQLLSLSCSPEQKYDVLTPEEEDYVLYYSDLHFENEEDCAGLKKLLRPEKLEKPADFNASIASCIKTILLVKSEDEPGYRGIGWGFELVRWEHEVKLRVGRICSPSPAHRAGLQTNDVIMSVGGRKINSFDQGNLISTILGATNICVRTEDSLDPDGIIPIVLGNIAETCTRDPVVLNVYRPSQEADDGTALDYPILQHDTHQISQFNQPSSSNSPTMSGDDDEVVVLHAKKNSNHSPNTLRPASQNESQESRVSATARRAQTYQLKAFYNHLRTLHDRRPVIRMEDLYFPAENGIVFTKAETALLLDCFVRKYLKLGIRLLCPRYNHVLVSSQVEVMAKWPVNIIERMPKLSDQMYKKMLVLDHKRATNSELPETGEVFFREVNRDANNPEPSHWEYRYPVDRLPIDRCLEKILANTTQQAEWQQAQNQQQEQHQQQFHHYENQPPPHYGPPPNRFELHQQYGQQQNTTPPQHYGPPTNQLESHQPHGQQQNTTPPQHYGPPANLLEPPIMMLHQAYDDNLTTYMGAYGQRIRGGGTSTADDRTLMRTRLSETSVGKWDGLPVYMFVQPEELQGDKMLVGFVKPPPDAELISEMAVDVEGHYLEDFGEFVDIQMLQAPSNEIFVVDMAATDNYGQHAVSVIRELYAQKKGPAKNRVNGTNDLDLGIQIQDSTDPQSSVETANSIENSNKNSLETSASAKTQEQHTTNNSDSYHHKEKAYAAHESNQDIMIETSSDVHTQSIPAPPTLKKMKGQMNCLGELPDGRICFWIVNDPGAIYLTTDELNDIKTTKICQHQYSCFLDTGVLAQNTSHARLIVRDVERYHCPWGCSFACERDSDNIREALSFSSQEDLMDHCKDCFSYEKLSSFIVGHHMRCIRISEGQKIRDLYCDLSAALYARSSAFDFLSASTEAPMKTNKSGTCFSQSPTGKRLFLVIDEKLDAKIEQLQTTLSAQKSTIICDLVRILENMFTLFEVEKTGNPRFNDEELLKYCLVGANESLRSMDVVESERLQDKKKSAEDSFCTNCVGCDLCSLPWKKSVPVETNSASDDKSVRCFGSGCCLINKLIRNSEMPKALPGSLGEAKVLLLAIGEIVPDQLKFRGQLAQYDHLGGRRLWNDNNHHTWKRFVMEATCTKQLSQAYLSLLASLEKNLLPSWWRTDGAGWSAARVILANREPSSLLLHVYVLDAAIAEYMCQRLYKKSTITMSPSKAIPPQRPKPKVTGKAPERMKKYMEIAKKQGWTRYEGESKEDCCICWDGGDLLCCDLCEKVQHARCCSPPIDDPESLDIFICQVCINDIEEEMKFTGIQELET